MLNNQKLIAALLTVAEQAKSGTLPKPNFRLCMNLTIELTGSCLSYEGYEAVGKIAHKFGLDGSDPIPRPSMAEFWQGRQLELRLDFISKMVTYLEIKDAQENCTSETI